MIFIWMNGMNNKKNARGIRQPTRDTLLCLCQTITFFCVGNFERHQDAVDINHLINLNQLSCNFNCNLWRWSYLERPYIKRHTLYPLQNKRILIKHCFFLLFFSLSFDLFFFSRLNTCVHSFLDQANRIE